MSTTYRLIAIDNGVERDAGLVETLALQPNDLLILSVSFETSNDDLERLRHEVRDVFSKYPAWRDRPIAVVRAGDARFLRLEPSS